MLQIVNLHHIEPTGEREKGSKQYFEKMQLLARNHAVQREVEALRQTLGFYHEDVSMRKNQMKQEIEDLMHQILTLDNLLTMQNRFGPNGALGEMSLLGARASMRCAGLPGRPAAQGPVSRLEPEPALDQLDSESSINASILACANTSHETSGWGDSGLDTFEFTFD